MLTDWISYMIYPICRLYVHMCIYNACLYMYVYIRYMILRMNPKQMIYLHLVGDTACLAR